MGCLHSGATDFGILDALIGLGARSLGLQSRATYCRLWDAFVGLGAGSPGSTNGLGPLISDSRSARRAPSTLAKHTDFMFCLEGHKCHLAITRAPFMKIVMERRFHN